MDSGDMLWQRPKIAAHERAQRQLKAELLLDAAALLDMTALGVGDGDLAFGVDFLVEGARKRGLPYLSANLADRDGALLFPATRVVEAGGVRVGLTSVLSDTMNFAGVRVLPTTASLQEAVSQLRSEDKVGLVVLLSHLGLEADKALAAEVDGIDLIFGGHTRSHQEEPLVVGTTAIMQAGSRGKHLGEVVVELRDGGVGWADSGARERVMTQRRRFEDQLAGYTRQLVELAPDDEKGRSRLERVRGFTERRIADLSIPPADDGSRNRLKSSKVAMSRKVADQPRMQQLVDVTLDKLGPDVSPLSKIKQPMAVDGSAKGGPRGPAGKVRPEQRVYGDFVGTKLCMACHRENYEDWRGTAHARAYSTLVKEKRHFDLDCWSCHVTGAGKAGGPSGPYDVGSMRNVQCEACHGAGRKHVADPTAVDMVRNPGEAHCRSCHSDEQTEGRFVYADYLPRIDHKP